MNIDDNNKVEVLKTLLSQFWTEVIHWREDSWRFTGWLVSIFILLAGVTVYKQQGALLASVILLLLCGGGTLYLRKNYDNYIDRLELFRNVEEALLLFEDNVYIKGKSILPKEKLHSLPTKKGTGIYIIVIWFVAVAAIIAMWLGTPAK